MLTILGRGVQFVSQLAMVLLLPKVLTPASFTEFNLLIPLAALGIPFAFGWLTGSVNRHAHEVLDPKDPRFRQTILIYYGYVSFALMFIFIVVSTFINSSYRLIPLLLMAGGLKDAIVGVLNMSGNNKGFLLINFGFALSLAVFIGLCSITTHDDLASYLTIYAILDATLAIYAWHRIGVATFRPRPHFYTDIYKRCFSYGWPAWCGSATLGDVCLRSISLGALEAH